MTNEDFENRPSALVVLLPAADDPVNAASSEDIAHNTFVWFGDVTDGESEDGTPFEAEHIQTQLAEYAMEVTPITVPVASRGELGDEGADVLFLEPTEALMALRDGLMAYPEVQAAFDATTQYPEWTPHVTLGYPDVPAEGEYDGDQITFDRFALWIGNERTEYPMAGKAVTASGDLALDPDAVDEAPVVTDAPAGETETSETETVAVHGVATIVGRPTGDGRVFDPAGLTLAPLPWPLGFEFESSHGGTNSRVAIVGRVDEAWIEGDEVRYKGVIMPHKDYAQQALEGIADGSFRGVSVKVDDVALDVSEQREEIIETLKRDRDANAEEEASGPELAKMSDQEIEDFADMLVGDGEMPLTKFARARVRNFDIVSFQAYIDAWINLGAEFVEGETEGLQPITASGRAPISIVASAASALPSGRFFRRPDALDEHGGGVIVDGDHVYGYIAEWGVCHIGIQEMCTTAPHSSTNYGYFATGYLATDEGDVRVGQITMGTGHAGDTVNGRIAAAHYDNTGAAVADVAVGEDDRGIWFSGMFRPSATAEQRRNLKASGRLSGDWRDWGMPELELVAALAVNVPGFPIQHTSLAASGGRQISLVAAGIVGQSTPLTASAGALSADEVAGIARAAVAEYVAIQDRRVKLAATAPLRQKLRAERVVAARARIEGRS